MTCPQRALVPALRTLLPCARCQRKPKSRSFLPAVLLSQPSAGCGEVAAPGSRTAATTPTPSPAPQGAKAAGERGGRIARSVIVHLGREMSCLGQHAVINQLFLGFCCFGLFLYTTQSTRTKYIMAYQHVSLETTPYSLAHGVGAGTVGD